MLPIVVNMKIFDTLFWYYGNVSDAEFLLQVFCLSW